MATVVGSATFRLFDYLGVTTSKIMYFQCADTTTIAQVIADLETFATLLNGVTDAASFAHLASFDINFQDANLKNTPVEGNPLSLNVASSYAEAVTGGTYSDLVPAAAQGQISGGKMIDTSGSPYNNYRNEFVTPTMAHLVPISQGERLLAAFHSSDLPTRKYRRKQRKVTTGV